MNPRLQIPTKFAPPRINARHVPRASLLAQLEQAQHCKLALVTGSAGYGKTTLLAQWRQACLHAGAAVGWLSLAGDERGFADFCAAFFAALGEVGVTVELDMSVEGASAPAVEQAVAAIVEAAADVPREMIVILDDYHHVEDPWAHKFVQKLLDHCPANLHLAIASRAAPPFSLGRLRVTDQLIEVDCAALPFTAAETRQFLEENVGTCKLDADELGVIQELTDGWPSCLQLIAIMLKNRPEARTRLRDLAWHSSDLQTYLSEEVLANLPRELVEFAESMSVFRRFNAALAEAATESPHAGALLARMDNDNLLVQRVESDDRAPWFRFHQLFSEFLGMRLERRGAAAVAGLHARATRWFASNGQLVEAVRHANLAGDVELAASVIEGAAPATWTLGYLVPVMHLLERLPQETLRKNRRLFFLACLTVALVARPAIARARIAQLEQGDTARHPDVARGMPLVHAIVALQAGETHRTIALLEDAPDAAAGNPFLGYLGLSALSAAYATAGRYADVRRLLESRPIPRQDQGNDMAIIAEASHVMCLLSEGEVREAARIGTPLLARALKARGRRSLCANLCAAFVADACYELDDIEAAREALANRHGLFASSGVEVMMRASLCKARLERLEHGPDAALAFLQQQTRRLQELGLTRAAAFLIAERIGFYVAGGDAVAAEGLCMELATLAEAQGEGEEVQPDVAALAALGRARVLSRAQPSQVLPWLERAERHATALGRGQMVTRVRLLKARSLDALGRTQDAMAQRVQAIESGSRLGLVRTFVDEGPLAEHEFSLALASNALSASAQEYARSVLARFPKVDGTETPAVVPRASAQRKQAVLTKREVEVLALVGHAMSNKRIALTLNITLETVKWNLRNIFAKLGVSSRYDAMIWARNQELIS